MTPDSVRAATPLEEAIAKGQTGEVSLADVLDAFEASRIIVPSRTDLTANDLSLLDPLVFRVGDARMLATFSHPDRMTDFVDQAPYALEVWGADLVTMVPPGSGVVVNPRHEVGLEIVPSLLDILRERRARMTSQP